MPTTTTTIAAAAPGAEGEDEPGHELHGPHHDEDPGDGRVLTVASCRGEVDRARPGRRQPGDLGAVEERRPPLLVEIPRVHPHGR